MPILALIALVAAPQSPPTLPGAYAALGEKRFDDAISAFSRVVQADPAALPQAWGWGMALYGKGDLVGARSLFDSILVAQPRHGRALYGRGLVTLRLGGTAEADFRAALALDEDDVRARFRLAQALSDTSQYEAAATELAQVLARRWIHQPARHALILALRDAGKPDEARRVAREFQAVQPLVEPIRAKERAVRAHPDDPALRQQLHGLYVQAGRTF